MLEVKIECFIGRNVMKKIFISYSWGNVETKDFVKRLAEKLCNPKLEVILDIWDLKPGHDMYHFMERSVNSSDKVLIICDKSYSKKANSRLGGVGTETRIISPDIYNKVEQEKFIPILLDGFENVPVYLKGILGIDLSNRNLEKEKIDEILKIIFEISENKRPINEIPDFLNDNSNNEITIVDNNLKTINLEAPYAEKDKIINLEINNNGNFNSEWDKIPIRIVASTQYNSLGNHLVYLHCYVLDKKPVCFDKIESIAFDIIEEDFDKDGIPEIAIEYSLGAHTRGFKVYKFESDLSLKLIEGSDIGSDTPLVKWGNANKTLPYELHSYNRNWGSDREKWQHSLEIYEYDRKNNKYFCREFSKMKCDDEKMVSIEKVIYDI